jgi:hypothetical protein
LQARLLPCHPLRTAPAAAAAAEAEAKGQFEAAAEAFLAARQVRLGSVCMRSLHPLRNFPTHGQLSAAQGNLTSCLNFDFAILNLFEPSAL